MIAIIAAIANENERHAIEQIFERYYPRMKAVAQSILHNEQDAEDAAMNTIGYMCHHPERFLDYTSKNTVSLVFMCLKNEAIDMYRKKQRQMDHTAFMDDDSSIEQIPDVDQSVVDIVISRENCDMLMQAIDQLDDMYKIPILLRYNHQMRNTEIAEFLHIDVNMVNGRLFRAKKKLAKKLAEMGYTHE